MLETPWENQQKIILIETWVCGLWLWYNSTSCEKNVVAKCSSQDFLVLHILNKLEVLHESLCYPGVTDMNHYIRIPNIPFIVEELRKVKSWSAAIEPHFYRRQSALIKVTALFKRLSRYFKGPLPANTYYKNLSKVVDDHSRFPFTIPCEGLSAKTMIEALGQIFSIFRILLTSILIGVHHLAPKNLNDMYTQKAYPQAKLHLTTIV